MCSNPFIAHQFFCSIFQGSRRSERREQIENAASNARATTRASPSPILRIDVTIPQQIDGNPQFDPRAHREASRRVPKKLFFCELRDAMGEPRDFAARRVAVHDALLRGADERRLGFRHGGEGAGAIACG